MNDDIDLLRELIGIDSVNPDLVPGAVGEARIARFVADWLGERGFECRTLERGADRASVLAVARGTGGGTSVMLNGHLDTVALSSYDGDGLVPEIRDGQLHGRGAYDMKSGVAAIMLAAARAAATPHAGDIVVALVADEEWMSFGTEDVLEQLRTDAAIVVEPSELDLVIAHRGFVWAEVVIHGVSAHGSRPDLGVDAIAKAGRFLTGVAELQARLAAGPRDPVLATGSVHASTISGGTEASTYPDRCAIVLERRTVPGEDEATFAGELHDILNRMAAEDAAFRSEVMVTASREAFATGEGSRTEAAVARAFESVAGRAVTRRGEPFWTDCALLGAAGIDTVLFGVAGGGAHAAIEWVDLDSFAIVVDVLERAVLDLTRA